MTFNQAKRELKSYAIISREEDDLLNEIAILKSRCLKVTTVFSDMPRGSYDVHKHETAMAELIDETNKYYALLDEIRDTKTTIKDKLERLEDDYRRVLFKRFILGKTLYETAEELHYSDRWIKKLVNKSIYEYSKL